MTAIIFNKSSPGRSNRAGNNRTNCCAKLPELSQREMTSVRSSGTASTVLGLKRQAVRINGANGNRATWTGGLRGRNRRACHAVASAKAGAIELVEPALSKAERNVARIEHPLLRTRAGVLLCEFLAWLSRKFRLSFGRFDENSLRQLATSAFWSTIRVANEKPRRT